MSPPNELENNSVSYFPIFVETEEYGKTRDELYEHLKTNNIFGRRYFYPLISQFRAYRGLSSARPENLPVAEAMTRKVICLPIYPGLALETVKSISVLIRDLAR
jgi:dTDP-4-amino-4,6-dideoxygalactose transaminase